MSDVALVHARCRWVVSMLFIPPVAVVSIPQLRLCGSWKSTTYFTLKCTLSAVEHLWSHWSFAALPPLDDRQCIIYWELELNRVSTSIRRRSIDLVA
jgi:hypothetical protein